MAERKAVAKNEKGDMREVTGRSVTSGREALGQPVELEDTGPQPRSGHDHRSLLQVRGGTTVADVQALDPPKGRTLGG
jgi:hypothetical protein